MFCVKALSHNATYPLQHGGAVVLLMTKMALVLLHVATGKNPMVWASSLQVILRFLIIMYDL